MKISFIFSITGIIVASTFSFSSFAVGEQSIDDASITAICKCVDEADANGGELSGNCHRLFTDTNREMEQPTRMPASHSQGALANIQNM